MDSVSMPLADRQIVVTGAARGLGLAICERLLQSGANVVAVDMNADRLATAVGVLDAAERLETVVVDITDEDAVAALFSERARPWGVVNNAALADGVGGMPFWEIETDEWHRVIGVNLDGTWQVAKHAARAMIRNGAGGRIINMASDAALYGSPRLGHYIASKGAIIALTRSMARDIGPYDITINAVSPGLTVGPSAEDIPAERHRLYADNRALSRPQQPADIIGAVSFLLSDEASYITGHNLVVDGGFVME